MSRKITINSPLIDEACITEALQQSKCIFTMDQSKNFTITESYYSIRLMKQSNLTYSFSGEDYVVRIVYDRIAPLYQKIYNRKLEEAAEAERIRIEKERALYVESQRQKVIQKAKSMGYIVKEEMVEETIKLVLIKRSYD